MPRTYSMTSSLTGIKAVDSLISGFQWESSKWWVPGAATNLTYSFTAPGISYFPTNYSADNEYKDMYALTPAQQTAVTGALASWSAVANITFQLTSDNAFTVGDMRFGGYAQLDNDSAAWGYFPSDDQSGGDVWIGPNTNDPTPDKGSYDFMTFIHEVGHAIGLKHPFSPGGLNSITLDPALDDVALTVMSYNNSYSYLPTTPMLLDILAIQSLYGANNLWMTGNNTYSWAPTQSVFETIWDAGGNDTIDGGNQLAAVRINLNEGEFSQIGKAFTDQNGNAFNEGLAIAFGAKIENAIGSAFDDSLIGNTLGNFLNGGAGADTMNGGAGNDTYIVDNVGDVVIENGTSLSEIDTVYAAINYTLGNNVENLILSGAANLNATGNALNNMLSGNSGNNILDGGAGTDYMVGGTGNDTYIVDNVGDVIVETSTLLNEIDTVLASVSYTLSSNVENLTLTGSANTTAIGNAQNNVLTGNDGDNTINGGAGLDTMIGGKGSDAYALDQAGELALIQENASEGTDKLFITYTAAQGNTVDLNTSNLVNVENVTLLGAGNFALLGNSLNNTLVGNADGNFINGGAGADIMDGGAGGDTYFVDNVGDVVIENGTSPSEIDSVYAFVDYALGNNVENLTLAGSALIAMGNALNNVLIGNDGDNTINGGAGLDTMIGGKGNDTYALDQAGELALLQENANEGTDKLFITYSAPPQSSTVDLNISNLLNVENVTVLGSGNFALLGNSLNNTLVGNADANFINGGAGADIMDGGAGNDTYFVDNAGDVLIENGASLSEIETVYAFIDYTLGNNLENLMLAGTTNLNATGNALNNMLSGNSGNNILDGGAGTDYMVGGTGNDTYIVDNVGDVIVETSTLLNEIDTVLASVSYTLSSNVENLTLTGSANTTAIGNAQNNVLTGNDGDNTINGGAGLDTMIGGKGSDAYALDQAGELALIQENASEGTDKLFITYTAAQGNTVDLNTSNLVNVENVTLLGAGNFALLGNSLNNTLVGNADGNFINGGAGADIMDGGAGGDTYFVDNVGDVVIENGTSPSEIDSVYAFVDYALGNNVENLTLAGTSNLNGTGNTLNNVLIGNSGNNTLDGGAGADFLTGGAGADTFVFSALSDMGTNARRDVITDFNSLQGDKIDLSKFDANLVSAGLDGFTFIGTGDFTGAGQLRFVDHILSGNVSGNAGADFEIQLVGVNSFSANDLVA
ncbi:M10 family metallopeptidase C-terminal domain-containing protein [Pseudomonas sp. NFX98]|uniref:M10 family metallopeptidase C-terminal domain-containing protein n=1 Tax=Pseudomonas sp. NFX98 TaxID=3399122 RepID=UPI0039FCE6E9